MPAATAIRGNTTARSALIARIATIPPHPLRVSPPPLRTADGHDLEERRASWLELFLDLVFAGAVGQLAGAFQEHPGMTALARFVLLFTPIWWLWVQLTFYADRHESDDAVHRAAVLTAILLCVGLAVSAQRAIAGDTDGFVAFFVCLRGVQLALYGRARRHMEATRALYTRYLIFFGAGGVLWLSSLSVAGPVRYAFWAAGLLSDAVGAMAMTSPRRHVPLNTSHLAERFQIFVLIVLGESVARLISAAAQRPWSLQLAVVLGAAMLTLAVLWRTWLTASDRKALDGPRPIASFTALNLPVVAGIAAGSAGLHIAILAADGASTIAIAPRAALYGGVSVYLLATAWLPSCKLSRCARATRVATAAAALGLVFMGAIVLPVYLVPALTAVLVIGFAVESHPACVAAVRRAFSPSHLARRPKTNDAGCAAMTGPGRGEVPEAQVWLASGRASQCQRRLPPAVVEAGTPVDEADAEWGRLPPHTAAGNGRPASVRRLLAHGADPNLRDRSHNTMPLEESHRENSPEHREVEAILVPLTHGDTTANQV